MQRAPVAKRFLSFDRGQMAFSSISKSSGHAMSHCIIFIQCEKKFLTIRRIETVIPLKYGPEQNKFKSFLKHCLTFGWSLWNRSTLNWQLFVTSQTHSDNDWRYKADAVSCGAVRRQFRLPFGVTQDEPSWRRRRRPSASATSSSTWRTAGRLPQRAQTQGYQLITCLTTVVMDTRFPSNRPPI